MKKLSVALLAALAMLGGCTANEGGDPEETASPESEAAAAPEVVEGQPIELGLEAPEGFTLAADTDRPELLLSESHASSVFVLGDGSTGDMLTVTSYVLSAPIAVGDFAGLVAVVAAYDATRSQPSETEKYLHAQVNGMAGVHRYNEIGADGVVKQYNHYLAVDSHLIQITCQWERDYGAVMDACYQLEQDFPVPQGWGPQLP